MCGCLGCCQIGFIRLTDYNNEFVKKTQLTCICHVNVHDEYFCSMSSTGVLQWDEEVCRGLHKLVEFCREHIFWTDVSCFEPSVCCQLTGESCCHPSV